MTAPLGILLVGGGFFAVSVYHDLGARRVRAVACAPDDRLAVAATRDGVPILPRLTADAVPPGIDLIVAAHPREFVGRLTRHRARLGAIGYHPSLLPRHRGRDAIRWTVHMREPVTGGTVFWLSDNVDAGPIAAQDWCHVRPDDDARSLWRRELQPLGVRLIRAVVQDLEAGVERRVPQDESLATWEPSWERPPLRRPELYLLPAPRA